MVSNNGAAASGALGYPLRRLPEAPALLHRSALSCVPDSCTIQEG